MVACPGVVRWFSHNDQLLPFPDFMGHFLVGGSDLVQHRCPVGTGMGPGQLDTLLGLPFCR